MAGLTEYLAALRMRESGGDYQIVNSYGFLGAYQFGEAALIDCGMVNRDASVSNNDFSGGWTGKYGITSREAFLASTEAQDLVAQDWMQVLWRYITAYDLAKYAGTTCGGIELTASGLIAGAHLMGVGGLSNWIKSGGTLNLCDQYGTPISEYIRTFGGYEIPWAPDPAPVPASGEVGVVEGTLGDDLLSGTSGNDTIRAREGDDTVTLDAGDDRLDGGAGSDWIVAGDGSPALTIDLALTGAQATGCGNDALVGFENVRGSSSGDRIQGDGAGNVLAGMGGGDTLNGRAGADRLIGGAGSDRLWGGADLDRDTFVFAAVGDSATGSKRDVVYDFVRGIDVIDLSGIDASVAAAGDQAFAFSGSGAAANAVWVVAQRGDGYLRGDVNGDGVADFEIRLSKVAALGASDFLL